MFYNFFSSIQINIYRFFHSSFSLSLDECCSTSIFAFVYGLLCAKLDFFRLHLREKLFIQNQPVESEITKIKWNGIIGGWCLLSGNVSGIHGEGRREISITWMAKPQNFNTVAFFRFSIYNYACMRPLIYSNEPITSIQVKIRCKTSKGSDGGLCDIRGSMSIEAPHLPDSFNKLHTLNACVHLELLPRPYHSRHLIRIMGIWKSPGATPLLRIWSEKNQRSVCAGFPFI